MIEVNFSTEQTIVVDPINQYTVGIDLLIYGAETGTDEVFTAEITHSNGSWFTMERAGRKYGSACVIPVPNYFLTLPGSIYVRFGARQITIPVISAPKPENYDYICDDDINTDQPMISNMNENGVRAYVPITNLQIDQICV